ncbi:Retrovirus-related Pol polyprotein from transposon [Zancudomyces culisetae]|uniref:Retrovirus-related Pol polyprotein from transposon n=1 Tax=Zancudomyces culisetae TaxID=1213189 RepID=A0A1R1PXI1_ZANCU|nr:Retrovirus-related Pol polyprotein from transposon [Zancudomyces culisetae]|eukprot:OMH85642.1 Retrovirus-related Pol polyprotein from transposon [Zancudomyces culisetae]
MNSIEKFSAATIDDPKEWIKGFRLFFKLNRYDEEDGIDLLQFYLGNQEKIWYLRNRKKFTNWEELKKLFIERFVSKTSDHKAIEKLKNINQQDFDSTDEFVFALELALSKCSINEEAQKVNWLISAASPRSRSRILESESREWDKVVSLITTSFEPSADSRNSDVPRDSNNNQYRTQGTGKSIKEMTEQKIGYNEMLSKMEEWSVNILTKVEEVVEKKVDKLLSERVYQRQQRTPYCTNCKVSGHYRHQCTSATPSKPDNDQPKKELNTIEVVTDNEVDNDLYLVQRPKPNKQVNKPYSKNKTLVDKKLPEVNKPTSVNKTIKYVKMEEDNDIKMNTESSVTKQVENSTNKKVKYGTRISENITPFNIQEDLNQYYPKISLAQLLDASPTLSSELSALCKKVKKLDINEIRVLPQKISNCRVLVSVFNRKYWAVVDTGAACSVTTPAIAEQWGLEPNEWTRQVLVTADGSRHLTGGVLNRVPIVIGNHTFEAEFIVMNRKDNTLILGNDWLYRHHAVLDPRSGELKMNTYSELLIVPMKSLAEKSESITLDSELYLLLKADEVIDLKNAFSDPRLTELKELNKDLFVSDIGELTQTDTTEHRIELTDNTPIKQRPYRIPHHMLQLDEAVQKLKDSLSSAPTLMHPNWDEEFILTTDASIEGIGAILSQKVEGGEKPIGYASKVTNKHERNYSVTHLEGLAVVWGVNKFKHYLWEDIVKQVHEENHEGIENTWRRVSREYTGNRLFETVKKTVKECLTCQSYQGHRTKRNELQPIYVYKPFSIFGLDAIGPISPISKHGNRFILTGIDYFTKWPVAEAVQNIQSDTIINFIITHIVKDFGTPDQIITDRGAGFISEAADNFYKYLGIRHTPTTSYRPQSNGQVERLNQTLKNTLARQCKKDKENWDTYMWKSLLAIRTMRNRSTGYSPAELLYGVKITTPAVWSPPAEPSDLDSAIQERIEAIGTNIPELRNIGLSRSVKAKQIMKSHYDKNITNFKFKVDEMVMKLVEHVTDKFQEVWEGPYKIVQKLNFGAYTIMDSDGNRDIVNGDSLKQFHHSSHMVPEVTRTLKSKLRRFKNPLSPIWSRGSVV